MNIKELTDLLVTSSQRTNQSQFIPWWEDDFEKSFYWYTIFPPKTVADAESILAECPKETLLAPVGTYGLSLFHLLIWHNFYDAVKKMLDEKKIDEKDLNLPDQNGNGLTPFLLACCRGNLSMVKLLLDYGAEDSQSDKRGMNAYHFLVYPRFEELVDGCAHKTALQRESIARILTCDINQKDENGFTPLTRLLCTPYCSEYTWPLTEVFLDKGADTDYRDENGNSLLMLSLINGHFTAALQLMNRHKELVHIPNKKGITPIQHSHNWNNKGICLALADCGATPMDDTFMDMDELSQLTSNAFCSRSDDDQDGIALALYLTEKLIKQVDVDDDDELGYVTNIFHNALISDPKFRVLDACKNAGLDFTMPLHYNGSIICLRDECLAIHYGRTNIIQKLIDLGVDMDTGIIRGQTPANQIASNKKHSLKSEDDMDGFQDAARLLSKDSMEELNNQGIAAIHLAAQNGHKGMLRVMIEKGVDVNLMEDAPAESGTTPLHVACKYGQWEIVKLLMAAGADDTLKNAKGETPAHCACALTNQILGDGLTSQQRLNVLNELKNLDLPGENGMTPLMQIQLLNHSTAKELLPMLIKRGVDVNRTDNNGMTALMYAADHSNKDTIKVLIQAGADINQTDNEGNAALYYSLDSGDAGLARYLIKKGANYNQPNNQGKTPVQIAVEKGFDTVLELMTDIE